MLSSIADIAAVPRQFTRPCSRASSAPRYPYPCAQACELNRSPMSALNRFWSNPEIGHRFAPMSKPRRRQPSAIVDDFAQQGQGDGDIEVEMAVLLPFSRA